MTRQVRRSLYITLPLLGAVALLTVIPAEAWFWNRDDAPAEADEDVLALDWADLLPEDFVPAEDPFRDITPERLDKLFDGSEESERELAEIEERMRYAPVDETLDGRRVSLPGYVVPLDFDGQTRLQEFLLVPYFGACIHTPPPPANQIVMASLKRPVEIGDTYEPVLLEGILRTETATSELAEAGYVMDVQSIKKYEP